MFDIAGGIIIAFFALWGFFEIFEGSEKTPLESRYLMTIWGPRIVVFATLVVLVIVLIKVI